MTTLRRLLVAVYPIGLFLLALAAWGVAADVRAESQISVGYYDMNVGAGSPEQVAPIVAAGFTPVQLFDVTATDLEGLHALFVQNSSTSGYGGEYRASAAAVKDAVNAGLVLIIHDRSLNGSPVPALGTRFILPLPPGVMFPLVSSAPSNDINVSDAATLVAGGPAGLITDTNLDNGQASNNGSVNLTFIPIPGRKSLLHRGALPFANNNSVTFSYPLGLGFVIYSSIPLDLFLKDMGMAAPAVREAFRTIYAPNVLTYAACGLKALPATVSAATATGHYGGTATLSATVKCGVMPVRDVTVDFSLNGIPVGSGQTDASGVATLENASLGSSADTAISVGSYPSGVLATFSGTALSGASSVTATLTVEKAPATITYDGGTFRYSGTPHAATGSVTGVFGEFLAAPSFTYADQHGVTAETAPVNAGRYVITATSAESTNYLSTTVNSSAAAITITPAPLKVIGDDKERLVGKVNPLLTVTYEGFVPGDTDASLDVAPSVVTSAALTSPDGIYPILVSGARDANYTIEEINGQLTVSPEGRIHGAGFVDGGGARHHFVFDARDTIVLGEKGSLTLRIDRETESDLFVSQIVTSVVFKNNAGVAPGGKATADALTLTGIGTWNGAVATFEALAVDKGEPAIGNDTVTINIRVGGRLVSTTHGTLNGGNVQSTRVSSK
jgi:hypothetical protein